jgi:hypothetical protein
MLLVDEPDGALFALCFMYGEMDSELSFEKL